MKKREEVVGMVKLPENSKVCMRCTDISLHQVFYNEDDYDKKNPNYYSKVTFAPEDFSFGELSFTATKTYDPDGYDLFDKFQKGGRYVLGIDINKKCKAKIVDLCEVI